MQWSIDIKKLMEVKPQYHQKGKKEVESKIEVWQVTLTHFHTGFQQLDKPTYANVNVNVNINVNIWNVAKFKSKFKIELWQVQWGFHIRSQAYQSESGKM